MGRRLRRAGARWRIQVHERPPGGYGKQWEVTDDPDAERRDREWMERYGADPALSEVVTLPTTEFDELVIGRWIHLEQMNSKTWWMNIGGVTINVQVDRDGRPQVVDVYGPDTYANAVEGVEYHLTWRDREDKHVGSEDPERK
jgi:hypothetical protein